MQAGCGGRGSGLALRGILILATLVLASGCVAGADDASLLKAGDVVRYHFTIRNAEGAVLYTSDPVLAAAELDAGNPWLEPDPAAKKYQPRILVLGPSAQDPHPYAAKVRPAEMLVGHRIGERVDSGLVDEMFPPPQRYELPEAFGPLSPRFRLDLDALYSDANRTKAVAALGPREALAVGSRVPYAEVAEAEVVALDGATMDLAIDLADGQVLRSRTLGLDLVAEATGDGTFLLRPVAAVGQVVDTAGCQLPVQDLPTGRYRVAAVEPRIVLADAPAFKDHLLGQRASLEAWAVERADDRDIPDVLRNGTTVIPKTGGMEE